MVTPIQEAISKGLEWLVQQQNADGSWGSAENYPIGTTGLVLLKLEAYALELGFDTPFENDYIYKSYVEDGLEYLFKQAVKDADDHIYFYEFGKICYQTGIALAAICANADPSHNVGNVGNPVVDGKTYKEVADSIVTYLALAQNANGGWAYEPFTADIPDNSVSGYVVLGLEIASAAKYKFNCVIPASVKTGLNNWIIHVQNENGGSGYQDSIFWINILKTGNLLQEMRLYGDSVSAARVQKAIQYIADHWYDPNGDPGWRGVPASYQATFTIMKGFSGYGIETIGSDIDWFADTSSVIISQQLEDGSWPFTEWDYDTKPILSTTWALLSLEKEIIPVPPLPLTTEDAINLLLASVAFEELGLAHLINAEAEKIQYVLGTLEEAPPLASPATIPDLLRINRSVDETLRNVIKKEMLLQFKLEDIISRCVSSTFDFPSVDSTVVAGTGFVNDVEVGYFWSVERGDRVSQTFSASDCVNRASLDVEVVTNILNSGAFVNWELVINGVSVGGFTVEEGFTGPISVDFVFPTITGPIYEVDLRVTNQVPGGEGSITLAYAGDFAHSLTLTCCNQNAADVAIKVAEEKVRSAPNAATQPEFSLEVNNRKP